VREGATFTYFHPVVRYVGLISPVIGPLEAPGLWPRSLPTGVEWMFQALDNEPGNPVLPQNTITRVAGTGGRNVNYADGHGRIGGDTAVLTEMVAEATQAGAPVH
jgi:prepilin-type processing-associated H-X9-DG protein